MTGHSTRITGYVFKDGKLKPANKKQSVSQRMAERKKPKTTYKRGK